MRETSTQAFNSPEIAALFTDINEQGGFGTNSWANLIRILLIEKEFVVKVGSEFIPIPVIEGMNFDFRVGRVEVKATVCEGYLLIHSPNFTGAKVNVLTKRFEGITKDGSYGRLVLKIKPDDQGSNYFRVYFMNIEGAIRVSTGKLKKKPRPNN